MVIYNGFSKINRDMFFGERPPIYKPCPGCEGTGEEIDGSLCSDCKGYGKIELTEDEYDELYMIDNDNYKED